MPPADGGGIVEREVSPVPPLSDVPSWLRAGEEEALAADLTVGSDASAAVGVVKAVWKKGLLNFSYMFC